MKRKFTPGKSFGFHIISGHVSESMQRKSRFWPLLTQQTHINPPESFYAETMSEWNAKIMFFFPFLSVPYSRLWVTEIFLLQWILYMYRYILNHVYIYHFQSEWNYNIEFYASCHDLEVFSTLNNLLHLFNGYLFFY